MLGCVFVVVVSALGWFRYHDDASAGVFFRVYALRSGLWLPAGICLIATLVTFINKGGPLVIHPLLISAGIWTGLITLLLHVGGEAAYRRRRASDRCERR